MFNLQRHAEIVGKLMVLYLRCEICFNFVHLARQSRSVVEEQNDMGILAVAASNFVIPFM